MKLNEMKCTARHFVSAPSRAADSPRSSHHVTANLLPYLSRERFRVNNLLDWLADLISD